MRLCLICFPLYLLWFEQSRRHGVDGRVGIQLLTVNSNGKQNAFSLYSVDDYRICLPPNVPTGRISLNTDCVTIRLNL